MENSDTRVDIAQNDVRGTRTTPQDLSGRGEAPTSLTGGTPGMTWQLSPTARRSLVGNPRRVRL